jgi:uncharacterized DUF497 family protein
MVGDETSNQYQITWAWPSLMRPRVFESVTYTFEDDRFTDGEQRFVTLGLLAGIAVSIVHTESVSEIRIISFRKATKREEKIYYDSIKN